MGSLVKSRLFWAALIVTIIAAIIFSGGFSAQKAATEDSFETVALDVGEIKRSVSTSGTVQPLVSVEVGSQLSGQLIAVLADFNSEVTEGDLLARIDPDTFQSRLDESQAQLNIARAGRSVALASLKRAQANLTQRRNDLARFEPLLEYDAISEIEVDAARAQFDAAIADYQSAEAQVENADAVVVQRQASLQQAKVDLQRTNIRAPINGVVILRNVDVGQTVAASLQAPVLFEIAQDLSKIQIEADVNEADIGSVRENNEVTFSVDAYPDRTFSGTVRQVRLAPKEESNIISYTVIINANNPGKILYPGMTASVEIITGQRENVLRVANSVLRFKPANAEITQNPTRRNGAGGGSDRMAELTKQLNLTEPQQKELRSRMSAIFASSQNASRAQGVSNPRDAVNKALRSILTEDQWSQYQSLRETDGTTRPATLWILDENEEPTPVRVRLGISDTSHTEVISESLTDGSNVIQRQAKG